MIGVYLNETRLTLAPESGPVLSLAASQPADRFRTLKTLLTKSASADASLCLAVNGFETTGQLGDLLADCLAEGLRPAGFFDSAVLASAAFGLQGLGVVLELQSHGAVATRVIENDGVYRRAAIAQAEACGLRDIRRACLQRIADVMVQQTRFDPLHDAKDEDALSNQLDDRLREVLVRGETTVELIALGKSLQVTLSLDDFVKALDPALRALRGLLQQIRSPGSDQYFLVPESLLQVPGIESMLASLGRSPVFGFEDDVVSRAAARCPLPSNHEGGLRFYRQVALPAFVAPRRLELATRVYRKPTHLLYENRVWALMGSLSLGRAVECAVTLPAGLAGVSRQHCTVITDATECVLVDHSRHGTWVNEDPVRGRQRLSAGDRIRIGVPGVELSLITVNDEHGQAAR